MLDTKFIKILTSEEVSMTTKNIICMGYGKCGTSLLNYLLKDTEEFIVPLKKKSCAISYHIDFPEVKKL